MRVEELHADYHRARETESGAELLARIQQHRESIKGARSTSRRLSAAAPKPVVGDALPLLPDGWVWARLDAIADIKGGITKDKKRNAKDCELLPYLRVANVQRGFLDLSEMKEIPVPKESVDALLLQPGDVLFNEGGDRDKLGRGWVWNGQIRRCVFQNHVFRARFYLPGSLEPKFISWYANTFGQDYFMAKGKQTTNLASINKTMLSAFPVPIAPLDQQKRIVAEIERQFSRLDEAVANLKRVKANLKRYKAAVLKAAVEGRLVETEAELARREDRTFQTAEKLLSTGEIRKTSKKRAGRLWGSGHVPALTDEESQRLPDGWVWTKVRDLGYEVEDAVQVGPMSMKSSEFSSGGVPVFNVGCVQWGYFDESKLNYLPEQVARKFARYRIRPGDVLFTRSGTVGRCAVARDYQLDWLMTFHLLRARPNPAKCIPEYLRAVFEGATHIRRQTREASIGSTRAGFNTNLLAALDVPLPPMAEQERIILEIDQRLSLLVKTEVQIDANLQRVEHLRRTVLGCAFAGQ